MKPHEQEWRSVAQHGFHGPEMVEEVTASEPDLVCTVMPPRGALGPGNDEPRARFIAAAPDMARALLEAIAKHQRTDGEGCHYCLGRFEETHAADCPIPVMRAALRKAGVLP